jgi:cell shape-determining protein MreC
LRFRSFTGSGFQIFAGSRFLIFAGSRLLKTYFTNFIKLGVSRVTGFPELPNTPLPGATPDFARQFQHAQDKPMLRREADELAQFLSNIQDTESESKKLEYKILFHQEFIYRCRSLLDGRKLPMLEEENARLVNPQVEELKLRNLL